MKFLLGLLIGFVFGIVVATVTLGHAERCRMLDTPLNLQLQIDRQIHIDREYEEALSLPLPRYTTPSLPCSQ